MSEELERGRRRLEKLAAGDDELLAVFRHVKGLEARVQDRERRIAGLQQQLSELNGLYREARLALADAQYGPLTPGPPSSTAGAGSPVGPPRPPSAGRGTQARGGG